MTSRIEQPSDRYRRVESLYQSVLDQPAESRRAYLTDHCHGDAVLLREVEELLEHFEEARHSFLGTPAHGLAAQAAVQESIPERIGRYRILAKLGEGGMGVVYRAEQDSPKREVALKVIRSGIASRDLLRRFELEAAVLGRLKHPGIAQIHEAHTYDDGKAKRPFFAMELIEGPPLNSYVTTNKLDTRARLGLFIKICEAVQHAHQKGVIHRDLKPSNILVVEEKATKRQSHEATKGLDRSPTASHRRFPSHGYPKILDFGVARVTDSDLQATTVRTDVQQVVGTLPYMSPEQVEGQGHLLDVRSDVYALGVILYELLAGRLPFDLGGKTVAAAARVICDEEPAPPGTISPAYRGDLNTIVLKALEKDPERRYQSASDLAADIRRYLQDEPIAARPATTLYQLRKFARRNRGLVAGVTAAFVVLVAGVIVSASLAVQRSRALEEANRQRDIAEAVNEFLDRDLLARANPSNEPNRSIMLREVVDRASQRIAGRFKDQPMVEAAIRTTLANTYKGLGEYAEAARHARAALDRLLSISSTPTYELLMTMNRVAFLEKKQGRMNEAEKLYRDALHRAEAAFGPEDETSMTLTNNLALVLERRQAYDEAAALLEPLLERRLRLLGEEHEHTMITMNNLALLYLSMERFDDAERLHRRELALSRRVMGPEHPDTLISIYNLAMVYVRREEFDKAEPLIRQVIASQSRVLGPDHPQTLISKSGLASVLTGQQRFSEAESTLLDALAPLEDKLGADHPQTLAARERLATLYLKTSRLEEAEAVARAAYDAAKRILGESHGTTGVYLGLLARIRFEQGDLEESESLGRRAYAILEQTYGPKHTNTRKVAEHMVDVYQRLDRPADAARWRARAEQ